MMEHFKSKVGIRLREHYYSLNIVIIIIVVHNKKRERAEPGHFMD
jgi:hypothetical protein